MKNKQKTSNEILEISPEQFRDMSAIEQKDFMLLGLQGKAKFTEDKENI